MAQFMTPYCQQRLIVHGLASDNCCYKKKKKSVHQKKTDARGNSFLKIIFKTFWCAGFQVMRAQTRTKLAFFWPNT